MQGSSFIKVLILCLFDIFLKKQKLSSTYPVWNYLHNDATQELFRECQLHTLYFRNTVYMRTDAENR